MGFVKGTGGGRRGERIGEEMTWNLLPKLPSRYCVRKAMLGRERFFSPCGLDSMEWGPKPARGRWHDSLKCLITRMRRNSLGTSVKFYPMMSSVKAKDPMQQPLSNTAC